MQVRKILKLPIFSGGGNRNGGPWVTQ